MNEEYKKLSELPQAVTPKNCEAYGIENGRSVRVPLIFPTLTEVKNEVTKETTRATNVENALSASIQKNASDITAEKSRAERAETSLFASIENMIDASLETFATKEQLTAEKDRAVGAEQTLQKNITAETTRATQAEQTLTENLNTAITNVTNSLNTETSNREQAETKIKNTTSKIVFTTDSTANEFFKEIYIYPQQTTNNIKQIAIDRSLETSSETYKWQITFITDDNKYSYAYLGSSDNVERSEYIKGVINGSDDAFGAGATFYAVVDWNKIGWGKTTTFNANLTSRVYNSKFSPIITHVLQSYKIVKGSLGNAFFKELYLENLRMEIYNEEGSLTEKHAIPYNEIETRLSTNNINRNVDGKWEINFGLRHNDNVAKFYKEFNQSPENDEVLVADLLSWINDGSTRYKAKMYAVVDWELIPDGTSLLYVRPLLPHILDKRFSPVIYSYIENEKLRKQIEQLTANINTTSEQE